MRKHEIRTWGQLFVIYRNIFIIWHTNQISHKERTSPAVISRQKNRLKMVEREIEGGRGLHADPCSRNVFLIITVHAIKRSLKKLNYLSFAIAVLKRFVVRCLKFYFYTSPFNRWDCINKKRFIRLNMNKTNILCFMKAIVPRNIFNRSSSFREMFQSFICNSLLQ